MEGKIIVLYALIWYSFSIFQTMVDKRFYLKYPLPITISFSHMLINPIGLWFAAYMSKAPQILLSRVHFVQVFCLAVFKVFVSVFSHYTSLLLTVPLMQALKSMSPIFVVTVSRFAYGTSYSSKVYSSLVLMMFGTVIATYTQHTIVYSGLLTSALMVVSSQSQNLFLKRTYDKIILNPFALLFNVHLVGFILVIPLWLFMDLPYILSSDDFEENPGWFFASCMLQGACSIMTHLMKVLILSTCTSLTYSVAETGKALFKVILGFVHYERPTGIMNVLGTLVALSGVLFYSKAKIEEKVKME